MVEKNTIICDVCDEHVAKCKCEICSKDICEGCTEETGIYFLDNVLLMNIPTCEKCNKQISRVCLSEENIFEEVLKDKPELRNEIVEIIKNVLMLKKISDDDVPEEEEESISLFPMPKVPSIIPVKPYPYPPLKPYNHKRPPYPYIDKRWKKWYSSTLNNNNAQKKTWWGGTK